MTKEERGKLYDKVYDEFIKLIEGKVDKVVISAYELYELSKRHYWTDVNDFNFYTFNTYADVLKNLCKDKNIMQEKDVLNNNYIFKLII